MVTSYASDVSHWKDWEKAYQYGVLLIIPPDPPLTQVNALRAKYDPQSQSTCDAHISLTIPLPRQLSQAQWRELASIASRINPFVIEYGPLKNYLPHPGVCLAIKPQAELDQIRAKLEASSVFEGAPARPHPFSAHMTIAEFISVAQTGTLMSELQGVTPEGKFVCTHVSYAVPDRNFHFTQRARLSLATNEKPRLTTNPQTAKPKSVNGICHRR